MTRVLSVVLLAAARCSGMWGHADAEDAEGREVADGDTPLDRPDASSDAADEVDDRLEAAEDSEVSDGPAEVCVPYDPTRPCGPYDCTCFDPPCEPTPDPFDIPCPAEAVWGGVNYASLYVDQPELCPGSPDPPGWRLRRDGTELIAVLGWTDVWKPVGCDGHCASLGFHGYVIDAASGVVLHAVQDNAWAIAWHSSPCGPPCRPDVVPGVDDGNCTEVLDRFSEWQVPPEATVAIPTLRHNYCCEVLLPELGIRYSYFESCVFPDDYRGARDRMIYGAIARNLMSTGQWLPAVDLPLVDESTSP